MADKLDRFRHLEKSRPEAHDPKEPPHKPGRFDAMEAPGASAPPASHPSSPHVERFREHEPKLALDQGRPEGLPFVRCAQCEMDHNLSITVCSNCGADLATPEQIRFNKKLAGQRAAEAAQEAKDHASLSAARAAEEERERIAQRESAEIMAREVGRQTRDQIDGYGGGFGYDGGYRPGWGRYEYGSFSDSIGMRLLRLIGNPVLRLGILLGAIAVPVILFLIGVRHAGARVGGFIGALVIVFLFSPPRRRRRGFWW